MRQTAPAEATTPRGKRRAGRHTRCGLGTCRRSPLSVESCNCVRGLNRRPLVGSAKRLPASLARLGNYVAWAGATWGGLRRRGTLRRHQPHTHRPRRRRPRPGNRQERHPSTRRNSHRHAPSRRRAPRHRATTTGRSPASERFGDKSWGQVPGSSGPPRASRGRGHQEPRRRIDPGKTRREAGLFALAAAHEILHGKEAVPGSSPGEGLNTCKTALCHNYRVPPESGRGRGSSRRQPRKLPRKSRSCPLQQSTSVLRRASTVWPLSG
jgi:hypothetical protein